MQKQVSKLSIVEVLQKIDDGGALEDLRDAIEQVTNAVVAAGKGAKGAVALTLVIERVNSKEVRVTDGIQTKEPKIVKEPSTFFVHPEGGLTRENPNQMALMNVDRETGEVLD